MNNFESNSTFLKHPNYFADPFHLNREEADFYTSDYVVKTLKTKIDRVFLGINKVLIKDKYHGKSIFIKQK